MPARWSAQTHNTNRHDSGSRGSAMEFVEGVDPTPVSIPLVRCRELLGEEAEGLTDEDVVRIRRHAETMAYVIVEMYLERRAASEQ
jgi:hypothetical protein